MNVSINYNLTPSDVIPLDQPKNSLLAIQSLQGQIDMLQEILEGASTFEDMESSILEGIKLLEASQVAMWQTIGFTAYPSQKPSAEKEEA